MTRKFKKNRYWRRTRLVLTWFFLPAIAFLLTSWGVFGHERINHTTVLALPPPLQTFFYNHIDFITLESTVPDLRKYTLADKSEKPRHYVDLENYGSRDSLPKNLAALNKKYDPVFLAENGILPWYIESLMEKLTKSFKEKRKTEILFLAADLGHYIGDAHMPLHTTVNHDGQLTDQKGIHSFWEAQLPDLFGKQYCVSTDEAKYISNLKTEIWSIIFSSHQLADSLLWADKKLSETFQANRIYMTDSDGKIAKNKFNKPIHTVEYATKYHSALNGMVEKQMLKAITATANFWYTAWINAGKPDLSSLDPPELTTRNAARLKTERQLWKEGKVVDLESEKEF